MPLTSAGIYLLATEHSEAIQRLAADPAIAATTRIPHPYPADAARDFIAAQIAAREKGSAWTFAIVDRNELVGVCGIEGLDHDDPPELGYWVGVPHWGKGYATFAVKRVLEFAFKNLMLDRIRAHALEANAASRRVLEKSGFAFLRLAPHYDAALGNLEQMVALYAISRTDWKEHRDGPALARLHPALRSILDAELAAGNDVAETGGGWPDPDSVFVRLVSPFRTRPEPLPTDLVYTEPNDPHWWKADYSSRSPRHILAC